MFILNCLTINFTVLGIYIVMESLNTITNKITESLNGVTQQFYSTLDYDNLKSHSTVLLNLPTQQSYSTEWFNLLTQQTDSTILLNGITQHTDSTESFNRFFKRNDSTYSLNNNLDCKNNDKLHSYKLSITAYKAFKF